MLVLGIDLETTGVDKIHDRIVEVGAVLWDTDLKVPVEIYSELVKEEDRPVIDSSFDVSHITPEMIDNYGQDPEDIISSIDDMVCKSDYIVAHNGLNFDQEMLQNFYKRYDHELSNEIWLDTRYHIDYPEMCKSRSLIYLMGYHGFVNPFPHRALFDVMTTLKILSNYDIHRVIEIAESPTIYLVAIVSFNRKDEAKQAGYMWEPDVRFDFDQKQKGFWIKERKLAMFDESELEESFEVRVEEEYQGKLRSDL